MVKEPGALAQGPAEQALGLGQELELGQVGPGRVQEARLGGTPAALLELLLDPLSAAAQWEESTVQDYRSNRGCKGPLIHGLEPARPSEPQV